MELRHFDVRIGHAVSDDLVDWQLLPDALWPRPEPAFDDGTTWTGSVVRDDDGGWRMFYTGTSRAEDCLAQRIGVARSDDLMTWTREGTAALVEADRAGTRPSTSRPGTTRPGVTRGSSATRRATAGRC